MKAPPPPRRVRAPLANQNCNVDNKLLKSFLSRQGFLEFSKSRGNDLTTPRPEYNFPGLSPGDRWCLCALRWKEAWEEGLAPAVILEACDEAALRYITLEILKDFAIKPSH